VVLTSGHSRERFIYNFFLGGGHGGHGGHGQTPSGFSLYEWSGPQPPSASPRVTPRARDRPSGAAFTQSARRRRPPPARPRPTCARRAPCRRPPSPAAPASGASHMRENAASGARARVRTEAPLAPQREPHVRLLRDLSARSVRPPAHETPAQEGCCACVHAHAAVAIASGACQQQRLQAEAEHVPHQRGAVKPWALSPVSGGYWQGRNATRDLRFCAAWALHAALALHGSLVH